MTELVSEGFGDSGWTNWATHIWGDDRWSIDSSRSESGGSSLRVWFPAGEHYGLHRMYKPPTNHTNLFVEYWVRFDSDFNPADSGGGSGSVKLPGFIYDNGYGASNPSDGYNGWSCKITIEPDGSADQYVYHMDNTGYGAHYQVTSSFPMGEWVKVTQEMKLNTVSGGTANRDGGFRVWINGELAREQMDLAFSLEPQQQGIDADFVVYFGGADPSPKNQGLNIDSFRIMTERASFTPPSQAVTDGTEKLTVRPV